MRKRALKVLAGAAFLTLFRLTGCGGPAAVMRQPPPPQTETRPARPFAEAVWIEGHWSWNRGRGRYEWIPGRWVRSEAGRTWNPGRWVKTSRGWIWKKGHWQ